jgi:iron complex transport system substrate-binding protein
VRIVSLLPSATDIVCSLGLRDALVGRTHECDWPHDIASVPVVTSDRLDTASMGSREIDRAVGSSVHSGSSIYALDHQALAEAKPDLILTQELCDVCAVSYKEVAKAARMLDVGVRVISLEPSTIDEILDTVRLVGDLTGTQHQAGDVIDDARRRLDAIRTTAAEREPVPTFCIEWLDPVYEAGHWVPDQVRTAGGELVLGRLGEPSRPVQWEDVVRSAPEALVLLPCGLSIERALKELEAIRTRPGWEKIPAVRTDNVWAVDGPSFFNRPGPRVVRGVEILAHVLHGVGAVSAEEAVRVEL